MILTDSPALASTFPVTAPTESAPASAPATRFTADGSPALEDHLAQTCRKIAAGLRGLLPPRRLEAVLLGGGYGRGEGGVLRTPEGDRPYNDLEFYVFLRGNRHLNDRLHGRAVHVLGEILTPQAGIEVEFKVASLRELARKPVSMFSYDLVAGHRWLIGSEEMLADCAHHRDAGQIPLTEATRLLMNRCTGLLFSQERLQRATFTAADADFTRRNIAKAELALGDAVLVTYGQYHWSVRERHQRLQRIAAAERRPWLAAVLRHHARGVEFKLHPERSLAAREALQRDHAAVSELARQAWLALESTRLRVEFRSARDYALHPVPKWTNSGRFRTRLVNARLFGPGAAVGREAGRDPRDRVLHALALLLWEPEALRSPALLARLQAGLRSDAGALSPLVRDYAALWSQVN